MSEGSVPKMEEDLAVRYSASKYDEYTANAVRHFDDALVWRLGQILSERGDSTGTLVDVGTGTAQFLIRAAREPELERLQFIGLDSFDDMVDEANRAVAEAGLSSQVEVRFGDAHELPVHEACAALVISRSTLHHFRDPLEAVKEMARVVAPDGMVVIHDVRRDAHPDARAAFNAEREKYGVPESIVEEKLSLADARALIEAAGLTDRTVITAPEDGPFALGFEIAIRGVQQ